jgi:hypothetical protein
MIQILTHGLFLTCTENSFYSAHKHIIFERVHFCLQENILTWKDDHLFMVANHHPHRSLAWSKLPLRSVHVPCPPNPLPANRAFIFTYRRTLTSPILLLGSWVYKKRISYWLQKCKCTLVPKCTKKLKFKKPFWRQNVTKSQICSFLNVLLILGGGHCFI